ncbi:MAG: DNA-processing protein DprA [Treponema sp.]|jgi:DNA processing protein|nr:DNA-processing protein DprA [Treponema sp.]
MDNRGLLDWMISRIPGLKGRDAKTLCMKFDHEGDLVLHSKNDLENLLGHTLGRRPWTWGEIRSGAEKDAAAACKRGIKTVSLVEEGYPPLVREIFDPPGLLFYLGALPDPRKPLAAVVGTRKPSSAGALQAFSLGRDLGRAGIPVVSGLALGIDAMAHRGNIEGYAPTLAVLGSGPDRIYPASNRGLARMILESGGGIVSEYPPGTGPMKWHFPARNRIISAFARGTVVVEAPERSGALITAAFALDQGRDLWVASAGLSSPLGKGTAKLVEDGAKLISCAADILAEWGIESGLAEKESGYGNSAGSALAAGLAKSLNIKL